MRLEATLRARTAAPRLAHVHQLGAQLAREEADRALATLDRLSDVERQVVRDMAELAGPAGALSCQPNTSRSVGVDGYDKVVSLAV